jgi:hypothetical protein
VNFYAYIAVPARHGNPPGVLGVKTEDNLLDLSAWPPRPAAFGQLLTPVEAAQYLRLDETNVHTPVSAVRTLNFWRDRGSLRATKYARHVWYLKSELDRFLLAKTE